MEPLKTTRLVMTWLCVFPADEPTNRWKKVAYLICYSSVLLGNIGNLAASSAYFVKYLSIDLEKALFAFSQMGAFLTSVYIIVTSLLLRHRIVVVFDGLAKIYVEYENDDCFRYLVRLNYKIEWMWKIFLKRFIPGFIIVTIAASAVSMLSSWLMTGHFDRTFAFVPERFILPWNQNSLRGYFFEMVFYNFTALAFFITCAMLLLPFVSICWHHQIFYEMSRHSLQQLGSPESNAKRDNKELLERLIRFHVSIKEWFWKTAELYRPYILVQIILFVIFLASAIFEIQLILKHPSTDIGMLIAISLMGLSNIFMYCYFGKLATESFEKMSNCLYESNWRKLPIDLQKYLIVMMANAQRPLFYDGFGMVIMNLETFCNVLRAILTYYMACRTLTLGE